MSEEISDLSLADTEALIDELMRRFSAPGYAMVIALWRPKEHKPEISEHSVSYAGGKAPALGLLDYARDAIKETIPSDRKDDDEG